MTETETEVRFYHMERSDLLQCLPALLSKALAGGRRVHIKAPAAQIKKLDEHLWVFDPDAFLPHGLADGPHGASQPICVSAQDENVNSADMLILTHGQESAQIGQYALCCTMIDGRDDQAVAAARTQWKIYKEQGFALTYWQQTTQGWEKKSD